MARSLDGTSQWISGASANVTALPMTFSAWVNVTRSNVDQSVCEVIANDGTGFLLWLTAGAKVRAYHVGVSGSLSFADTSTSISNNVWAHVCAVFASNSSRSAYLNGGGKVTDTAVCNAPSSITNTGIGLYTAGSLKPLAGLIAEVAMWNAALGDDRVLELSTGRSPLSVQPENLRAYWPLIGRDSPEIDIVRSLNLTVAASAPQADHCRVIYPKGLILPPKRTVAAGGPFPHYTRRRMTGGMIAMGC